MKPALLILLVFPQLLWAQAAERYLSADDWARPRHGEALVQWPALAQTMAALSRSPDTRLMIRYPGGETGSLWAQELRGWLVSLGLASSRMELVAGSAREDAIGLRVVQTP